MLASLGEGWHGPFLLGSYRRNSQVHGRLLLPYVMIDEVENVMECLVLRHGPNGSRD